ncbi:hypothetical protein V6N12_009322 [Hibiscus sabdariffa]|uniref:Uncharacterized protein n=1 Tax=Hibiscus sabdariffa TaxID=183260 RepID=A0ABR2E988_9ROSI
MIGLWAYSNSSDIPWRPDIDNPTHLPNCFSVRDCRRTPLPEPSSIRSKRKVVFVVASDSDTDVQVVAKPTPTCIQPPRSTKKPKAQSRRKLIIDSDSEESCESLMA